MKVLDTLTALARLYDWQQAGRPPLLALAPDMRASAPAPQFAGLAPLGRRPSTPRPGLTRPAVETQQPRAEPGRRAPSEAR